MSKKPTPSEIRAVLPLSKMCTRGEDPILVCGICGQKAEQLDAWIEHDEFDRPLLDGPEHLVFLGTDHAACNRQLTLHPRLYERVTGRPGTFPRLCGPCVNRRGFDCAHPKLKANGGPGLLVQISDPLRGAIICGRGGRQRVLKPAVSCEGRTMLKVLL